MTPADLDAEARRDLRGLQKDTADSVARHLVVAGMLVDEDPEQALEHARYARKRASRIAVVREAAGIAAYHAGEWAEALSDLRAAKRMGGGAGHLAVMADIERALGRPERAVELSRSPETKELSAAESIELMIVVAGARRDLGEIDASVVALQMPELDAARRDPWSARLFYAYADNLLAADRTADALQWFVHALDADTAGETDAADRVADLTGEPVEVDEVDFDVDDTDAPVIGAPVIGAPVIDAAVIGAAAHGESGDEPGTVAPVVDQAVDAEPVAEAAEPADDVDEAGAGPAVVVADAAPESAAPPAADEPADAADPATAVPDAAVPDAAVPDAAVPDGAAPDAGPDDDGPGGATP